MPRSATSYGSIRGDKLIYYEDNDDVDSKYSFIKSFQVGKYNTKGENIIVTYKTGYAAPSSATIEDEIMISIDQDYETDFLLNFLNSNNMIYDTTSGVGLRFEKGYIEPVGGAVATVRFTTGIANRLGFEDNKVYTIDSKVESNYPPIDKEPLYFVFTVKDHTVIIYPNSNTIYNVNYPVFKKPSFRKIYPLLEDDNNNIIYVPATFELTMLDQNNKDINFRKVGVSQITGDRHLLSFASKGEYAIKSVYINDAQIFTGNESVMIHGYPIRTINVDYYITNNFTISNVGTKLLEDDTEIRRTVIVAYDEDRYIALPVYNGIDEVAPFNLEIPQVEKSYSAIRFSITGITPAVSIGDFPITNTQVHAEKGQLNLSHISSLSTGPIDTIDTDNNEISLTGNTNNLIGFSSTHPQYIELLKGAGINSYTKLNNLYNFESSLPIGQRQPIIYKLQFDGGEKTISSCETSVIEWNVNRSLSARKPIKVISLDSNNEIIRELTLKEYAVMFLFRSTK